MSIRQTIVGLTFSLLAASSTAGQPPQIAGTWNVTSTTTEDFTCKQVRPGDVNASIWIVSTAADGSISVSVQGKTSFPVLEGRWVDDSGTLILEGDAKGRAYEKATSWLKLTYKEDDSLEGVRRVLSGNQSKSHRACFADLEIHAKR